MQSPWRGNTLHRRGARMVINLNTIRKSIASYLRIDTFGGEGLQRFFAECKGSNDAGPADVASLQQPRPAITSYEIISHSFNRH